MKKVERLRGPRVFEAVRTRGIVLDGRLLRFFYTLHPGPGSPIEFGIVMGKRHGPAVLRNRLKRRMRAACREVLGAHAAVFQAKQLKVSVVMVFRGAKGRPPAGISYAEIRDDASVLARAILTSVAEINGTRADLSGA